MVINFLDTSAVLAGGLSEFDNIHISPITLQELEYIKTSALKDDATKVAARNAIKNIITHNLQTVSCQSDRKIESLFKKYNFLPKNNDSIILLNALFQQIHYHKQVHFITGDSAQYTFAQQLPIFQVTLYKEGHSDERQLCGWGRYYPNEEILNLLYSDNKINSLKSPINEFAEIFVNGELKDVKCWNGENYNNLKYSTFKNIFNETIAPRNLEQKMLFHLLQDDNIKVKLAIGSWGTGKTYIMLQHALKGIKDGKFSRIIFVRNNIITKGSRDIGFLAGSMVEKIKPYLMPIADLTTPDYLDELIETETLVPVPLAFMRGRDFSNSSLVFVDEAENLTKENVQLLLGRIGDGSQLWFAGDLRQIDHYDFQKNNGLRILMNRLYGNPLFGMVKLIRAERSITSQLADLLD